VDRQDAYKWSSHRGYISSAKKWDWLYKEFVFSMLSDDKKHHRQAYREFLAEDDFTEINKIFEGEKFPSVLGSERFVNRIRDKFFDKKSHEEVPESRLLAPSRERIKRVVCETYRVNEEVLLKSKRGTFNEPRNVAIYLCRRLRADRLDEICQEFGMKRYSTASSVLERVKVHQSRDRRFRKRVEELRIMLTKSQT
jgi:chromosomal replication initiation ATPase DnaA